MDDWKLVIARGETTNVDFKGPMEWSDPARASLTADIVGMTNTRDGGVILIGVSEGGDGRPVIDGLTADQAASFDPTKVSDYVATYFQPAVRVRVERPEVDGKCLVAIRVTEFETTPTICIKDGPPKNPGGKRLFYAGDLFVRTAAAKTVKISTAEDMQALVRLAVTKTSDALLQDMRRILEGAPARAEPVAPYANELRAWKETLAEKAQAWTAKFPTHGWFSMVLLPRAPLATPLVEADLHRLVEQSQAQGSGLTLPSCRQDQFTRIQNRQGFIEGSLDLKDYQEVWQLHTSGAFLYAHMLHYDTDNNSEIVLPLEVVIILTALGLIFALRLFHEVMPQGEIEAGFGLHGVKDQRLGMFKSRLWPMSPHYKTAEEDIHVSETTSVLDLRSGWRQVVERVVKPIFRLFNFDISHEAVAQNLDELEGKR